jgi:SpoIID/LytB domain protein
MRFRSPAAVLLALVLSSSFAQPAQASSGSFVFVGHGWGHGIGLGQWGARGMAEAGKSWKQIVGHYYRGVRVARAAPPDVRVLVAQRRVALLPARGTSAWINGRRAAHLGRRTRAFRVRASGRGLVLEVHRGKWRRLRTARAPIWFWRRGAVELATRGGARAYRGRLQVRRAGSGVAIVNQVSMDGYLAGVVPREMPASWPPHALRAQAVAARTYATRVRAGARARHASYDICATTACQVYAGRARRPAGANWILLEDRRANSAIRATHGVVLTYGGRAILAQYSSSTGGYSNRGSAPYLSPVSDRYDDGSPMHTWRVDVSASRLARAFPGIGTPRAITVVERTAYRAARVVVEGSRGRARVSGHRIVAALGLRSRWFYVRGGSRAARSSSSSRRATFHRNLSFGMSGSDVRALQLRLRRERVFPPRAPITGYFGDVTRAAVRRYQRAHRIRQTGIVGPRTRAALNRRRS